MGDVLVGAAQEVWQLLVDAVTDPGPWSIVVGVMFLIIVVAILRGRLTSPWVWIPALGVVGFWAYEHLVRYY